MYVIFDINNNKTWGNFDTVTKAIEFCIHIAEPNGKYAILIKDKEVLLNPPSYSISIPC